MRNFSVSVSETNLLDPGGQEQQSRQSKKKSKTFFFSLSHSRGPKRALRSRTAGVSREFMIVYRSPRECQSISCCPINSADVIIVHKLTLLGPKEIDEYQKSAPRRWKTNSGLADLGRLAFRAIFFSSLSHSRA